jgi:peptide/nickel transport system substrate-binding protein
VASLKRMRALAVGLAALVALAGCGGSGGSSAAKAQTVDKIAPGFVNVSGKQPKPTDGGTLNFSLYSQMATLDPAKETATGATGGTVLTALYDVLVRYDDKSGKFVPQMAKSIEPNADFTEWTLQLPSGITFSDGTPLDSNAVVFNLTRLAQSRSVAASFAKRIDRFTTPDAQTVVFHLTSAWAQFPFLLSTTGGMIASPTAVQAGGPEFWKQPAGAGPFVLKSFAPNEAIVLVRNPNYWGGKVHLDEVKFTQIAGDQATADRFRSKDVDMGMVVDSEVVTQLVKEGVSGHVTLKAGSGYIANSNQGHPTADRRVRQAIAYALDLKQLNDRAAGGAGTYQSSLFPESSRWYTGNGGVAHDPEKARQLVKEVQAETGWDGSLRLAVVRALSDRWNEALTVQAQLNSVGFRVDVVDVTDTNGKIKTVFVDKNYDIADWSVPAWESVPAFNLLANLSTGGSFNAYGYSNPDMDRILNDLLAAPDDKAALGVVRQLEELWKVEQPLILTQSEVYFTFWSDKVHGVAPTSMGNMLLDDVSVAK